MLTQGNTICHANRVLVTPANAGVQTLLDSGVRRNDVEAWPRLGGMLLQRPARCRSLVMSDHPRFPPNNCMLAYSTAFPLHEMEQWSKLKD